jgi:hypothetical protein
LQLPIVVVDSNLSELLERPFEATLTARTASAALLLQGLFGKFLHSSSHKYADCHFQQTKYVTHTDPAAVHLLSTESFESVSTGSRHSRVAKTRIALRMPHIRDVLNVCIHPREDGRNCSRCEKCLRTLATLDLLGELEGFDRVFDLDLYRQWTNRLQYLLLLPGRTDNSFMKELFDFARTGDARMPGYIARFHDAWPVLGVPYRTVKAARKQFRRALG